MGRSHNFKWSNCALSTLYTPKTLSLIFIYLSDSFNKTAHSWTWTWNYIRNGKFDCWKIFSAYLLFLTLVANIAWNINIVFHLRKTVTLKCSLQWNIKDEAFEAVNSTTIFVKWKLHVSQILVERNLRFVGIFHFIL